MSDLTFVVGEQTLTADQLKATAPRRQVVRRETLKRVDKRDDATSSDGFVVLGYTPDQMQSLDTDYSIECKNAVESGKAPKPRDEFETSWLRKNKPKRVRSRPYELESAAETCADLARRAGWSHVRVDEILKG